MDYRAVTYEKIVFTAKYVDDEIEYMIKTYINLSIKSKSLSNEYSIYSSYSYEALEALNKTDFSDFPAIVE